MATVYLVYNETNGSLDPMIYSTDPETRIVVLDSDFDGTQDEDHIADAYSHFCLARSDGQVHLVHRP